MTNYNLYIDGQQVDMSTEAVQITFKSNLLGELGKIVAGSSQTIKLPRTVKNMSILGLPEIPSYNGGKIRRKLKVTLISNGIELIKDGVAVILSTSEDGYEIGITFGVVAFLSAVKESGNLNDLPDEGDYVEWNAESQTISPVATLDPNGELYSRNNIGFGDYDNGVNDTSKVNVHPAVSCRWLMEKIENTYSFRVNDEWRELLSDKYILLAEKRNSKAAIDESFGYYLSNELSVVIIGATQTSKSYGLVKITETSIQAYNIEPRYQKIFIRQKVNGLTVTCKVKGFADESATMYLLRSTTVPLKGYVASTTIGSDGWWYISTHIDGEIEQGEWISIAFSTYKESDITAEIIVDPDTYVWDEDEEPGDVEYGGIYPIIPNLPNIKITEFIQMCGVLTGRWPLVNPNVANTLEMVSVDDLLIGDVVDWSDKWDGEPDSVAYTLLEAQENIIQYSNDEDVTKAGVSSRTSIVVNDDTLEREKELYEIPFSASQGNYIPQYSIVDGKLEEGDVSERLLVNRQDNELWYDDSLKPSTLKATVLKSYAELVKQPVVIKGTFRLTEIDIKNLRYDRRVYLRQLGRHYGIVQIQYKGDESSVELLQLPIVE